MTVWTVSLTDTPLPELETFTLAASNQRKTHIRNRPAIKQRQARKILRQVLKHGRPVNLPDGRRASKRAIRRTRASNPGILDGSDPQELEHTAALARRFDRARRRQEQIFDRIFKRATRSRACRTPAA